jgi:hypothetical protein
MPSSSMRVACSTEATPARMAFLMPSAAWACAATLRPKLAASSRHGQVRTDRLDLCASNDNDLIGKRTAPLQVDEFSGPDDRNRLRRSSTYALQTEGNILFIDRSSTTDAATRLHSLLPYRVCAPDGYANE